MDLSLLPKQVTTRRKKRLGRGYASGKGGHTSSRGMKGQKSRGGFNVPFGFEGGQIPLYKKLPRINGFRNPRAKLFTIMNIGDLEMLEEGTLVSPKTLLKKKLVKTVAKYGVKILGTGEFTKKLRFEDISFSASAKKAVEKTGSTIKVSEDKADKE